MKNKLNMGHLSVHHLVPKQRLRDYYGISFHLPKNNLRLWRKRHDAWHNLFGNKTINEIIRYLRGRTNHIKGYKKTNWLILFGKKNRKDAQKLLIRMRNIIRKKYAYFELDAKLREKAYWITNTHNQRAYARILFNKRFTQSA